MDGWSVDITVSGATYSVPLPDMTLTPGAESVPVVLVDDRLPRDLIQLERAACILRLDGVEWSRGVLSSVSHGGQGEAITGRLVIEWQTADGVMPRPTERVDNTTYFQAYIPNNAQGATYPLIFGSPGDAGSNVPSAVVPIPLARLNQPAATDYFVMLAGISPATRVRLRSTKAAIVAADTVTILSVGTGDRLRQPGTGISGASTVLAKDADTDYFVGFWRSDPAMKLIGSPSGQAGLARVARHVIQTYTSLSIDEAQWERHEVNLDAYQVDAWIDAPIAPVEWIERVLLPMADASFVRTSRGVYLRPRRYTATASQAIRWLSAERGNLRRMSPVRTADPIYNEFTVDFRWTGNGYRSRRILTATGQPKVYGEPDNRVLGSALCAESQERYGVRPAPVDEVSATWEGATAVRVLEQRAARYALPRARVTYTGGRDLRGLTEGDVLVISDAAIGWSERVVIVDSPPEISARNVTIDVVTVT